jgi:hypothetical protein
LWTRKTGVCRNPLGGLSALSAPLRATLEEDVARGGAENAEANREVFDPAKPLPIKDDAFRLTDTLTFCPGLQAMTAPKKVLELVDLFRRNADAYLSPHYNEAQIRQEFINPLFKCLG